MVAAGVPATLLLKLLGVSFSTMPHIKGIAESIHGRGLGDQRYVLRDQRVCIVQYAALFGRAAFGSAGVVGT